MRSLIAWFADLAFGPACPHRCRHWHGARTRSVTPTPTMHASTNAPTESSDFRRLGSRNSDYDGG